MTDVPTATATAEAAASSRYLGLKPRAARGLFAALVLVVGWFLAAEGGHRHPTTPTAPPGLSDVDLYQAILGRLQHGEGYYDAVGAELRGRGYPTRPSFNWRQPTWAFVLRALPEGGDVVLLALVCLAALEATRRWVEREWGRRPAMLVCLFYGGTVVYSLAGTVFQEVWAGHLILLGTALYALGHRRAGALSLAAALAFREHALLAVGVAVLLALVERRRGELAFWGVTLALYAALMSWHIHLVNQHLVAADFVATPRSWLAFGGPRFLVSTSRWNAWWYWLPPATIALALPLSLFGIAGFRAPGALRTTLTLGGYYLALMVVGQSFNTYWGLLFLPLVSVGLIRAPRALRELVSASRVSAASLELLPARQ